MLASQQAVGPRQRQNSSLEGIDYFLVRGTAQGLPGDRLHGGERILRAVVQLVQQKPEAISLLLVLGEIHERGEMLRNIAGLVPNRADEDGSPKRVAILAAETNFKIAFGTARVGGFDLR